ncbi:MAG: TlyA family rRNA (cytidine-2'-O)-methyltransferase [Streptosporangiales bacterium]|nr:TlyA family rRNA (cytidine-2'-O)-methyltransferase [Streptosporangiales bacterium]
MTTSSRLDLELVRRGLARSRRQAQDLVTAGRVSVGGHPATRPARAVPTGAAIDVSGDVGAAYASRAGAKLATALESFAGDGLDVAGRRALDAGASTGGFTDVLLRAGVTEVVAVDVGHGQFADALRDDPRVRVHERTNVRDLTPDAIGGPVALVVADLSFISLTLVLPALVGCCEPGADLVLLVKPQFEVGRRALRSTGVVRSPRLRREAVDGVVAAAHELDLGVGGLVGSDLPGVRGNVEYLLWVRGGPDSVPGDLVSRVVGASA